MTSLPPPSDPAAWTPPHEPGTAPPPPPAPTRPWWKRKRVLIPVGALAAMGLIGALNGPPDPVVTAATAPSQAVTSSTESTPPAPVATPAAASPETTTEATTDTPEPTPEPPSYAGDYDGTFGTFPVVNKSGRGDATVKLPAGLQGAVLTVTHRGYSNFVVTSLDSANHQVDLLVNDIGRYSGTTLLQAGNGAAPAKLKIEADGRWTLTIRPVAQAPKLTSGKRAGTGDAVLLYEMPAADWRITHKGSSNFVVTAVGNDDGLLVNEIGRYDGVVPMSDGPAVLVIQADGAWTLTKQ